MHINEKVAIRKLSLKDVEVLLNVGFLYKSVLEESFGKGFSKIVGLIPRSIGIVACSIQEDRALGFLSLVEHTHRLSSIKFVFVDPNFRKLGIATGLINYAKSLAKERGAKKVFLNANSIDNALVHFYIKRGFNLITNGSMVWGGGSSDKLKKEKLKTLNSFETNSEERKQQAFNVYKKCMGQGWINFFEINMKNLINGFSQDYTPHLFSKNGFIIKSANSLVLLSKIPFLHSGFTELYVPPDSDMSFVFNELSQILSKRNVIYSKLTVFNIYGSECFDLLKKMEFYPFQAQILGLTL